MSPLDKQGASEESWCHAQTNPELLLVNNDTTAGTLWQHPWWCSRGHWDIFWITAEKPCIEVKLISQAIFEMKILPAQPCRFIKALFAASVTGKSGSGIAERASCSGNVDTSFVFFFPSLPRIIYTASAPLTVWRWLQRYHTTEWSHGANEWHQRDIVYDEVFAHTLRKWNNSLY